MQISGDEITNLLDTITSAIFVFSEKRILYTNAAAQALTHYSRDQLTQMRMVDLLHPDFRADFSCYHLGMSSNLEFRFLTGDGRTPWVDMKHVPVHFDGREACLVTAVEITRFKQIDEALRIGEERYRIITELSSDYAYVMRVNPDGNIEREWISGAIQDISGYSPDEVSERGGWAALTHPDDLPRVVEELISLLEAEAEREFEYRIVTKSGETRYVQARNRSVYDNSLKRVNRIYGMVKDITQRRQAEEALRQSEHHFRLLAENSPDYIYIFDLQIHQVIYFSKSEFLGYSLAELSHGDSIINALHPEDGASTIEHGRQVIMDRVTDAGAVDYRVLHKDGHWEWVQFRSSVLTHDNTGKPMRLLVTLSIVTERKRLEDMTLERERLHVALEKEQELNELKTKMMERISHEFRTPLSTILISTQLLERYGERFPPEKRQKNFEQIKNQVNHVTRILDDISLIVRGGSDYRDFRASALDLEQLSREMVARLQAEMQTDHTFTFDFSEATHQATADRALTQLILYHLLSNAIKYSDWQTTVHLEAEVDGGEIILRIRDEGVGILPREQPRIFEAFYRGSNFDERPGLGLGLAIVKIAVELQQGKVLFTSLPKQGTTFVVHLPMVSDI